MPQSLRKHSFELRSLNLIGPAMQDILDDSEIHDALMQLQLNPQVQEKMQARNLQIDAFLKHIDAFNMRAASVMKTEIREWLLQCASAPHMVDEAFEKVLHLQRDADASFRKGEHVIVFSRSADRWVEAVVVDPQSKDRHVVVEFYLENLLCQKRLTPDSDLLIRERDPECIGVAVVCVVVVGAMFLAGSRRHPRGGFHPEATPNYPFGPDGPGCSDGPDVGAGIQMCKEILRKR